MNTIVFTHDCDKCGTEMRNAVGLLDNNDYPVTFVSQMTFTCPNCYLEHCVGDVDIYNENEI